MDRTIKRLLVILLAGNILFLTISFYLGLAIKNTTKKLEDEKLSYSDSLKLFKTLANASYHMLLSDSIRARKAFALADSARMDQRPWSLLYVAFKQLHDSVLSSSNKWHRISNALGRELHQQKLFSNKLQEIIKQYQEETDSLTALTQENTRHFSELRERILAMEKTLEEIRNSKGKLIFSTSESSNILYYGEISQGKANGYGIGIFQSKGIYEGSWKDNLWHGNGVYQWANGDRYEGEFFEGKRHGYGIYYFSTGERFEGYWKNDLRDGMGTFYSADGKVLVQGIWRSDKFIKNPTFNDQ